MNAPQSSPPTIALGDDPLTIEELERVALGAAMTLTESRRQRVEHAARQLSQLLLSGARAYGINTGYGASVENAIPAEWIAELPHHLVAYHGCGTGAPFDEASTRAIIGARVCSLAAGWSGVRLEIVERLQWMLAAGQLPLIPSEGSVGASGDLTPLSYVAAALIGEREVRSGDGCRPTSAALAEAGLAPLQLGPKEALAMMNGTSVMTALGCLAVARAERAARTAAAITAIVSQAIRGAEQCFDVRVQTARPHPGQAKVASWIRSMRAGATHPAPAARLQDRYSVRCAPQIIGALVDFLAPIRQTLEVELNGVSDNPLLDPESGELLHGGNFYGGHVCLALDTLRAAVVNLADLADRQLVLLCEPRESDGLPANLVGITGPEQALHHGFKAMQISASSLTAEASRLTMPASVFSRSTESHNQDKVSMGTHSARDTLRALELTERVLAIGLLAATQAMDLRGAAEFGAGALDVHQAVRALSPRLEADRRLDRDIMSVAAQLATPETPLSTALKLGVGQ